MRNLSSTNFSENLKQARALAGLSQVKTAASLGVPRRTYENWEMGIREPAQYTQQAILKQLEGMAMPKANE